MRQNASIASATNPSYQVCSAASICRSRSTPAASASTRTCRNVAASAGLANSVPATGGRLPGSHTCAEECHSVRNRSAIAPTVAAAPGAIGCPVSAYPMAYPSTSRSRLVPWSRSSAS